MNYGYSQYVHPRNDHDRWASRGRQEHCGELLARQLGYLYFDTGVMYRALTWAALRRGVDPQAGAALAALARQLKIEVLPPLAADGRQYTVLADGQDVTWELRLPEVERYVSLVSSYPAVREVLRAQQRAIGLRGRIVMVGRDIGNIVMPDAALKSTWRRRWRNAHAAAPPRSAGVASTCGPTRCWRRSRARCSRPARDGAGLRRGGAA